MSNYKYDDEPIRETQNRSKGKEIDEKIKNFQYSWENVDDWEYEEELDNFERIHKKNKKKG